MECPKCKATMIQKENYMVCLNQYCGYRIPCCEELLEEIERLKGIIEELNKEMSHNA